MEQLVSHLGYGGPRFIWDKEERRHLRARHDALYFHLCGLDRADAGYILDTFPPSAAKTRPIRRPLPHQKAYPCLYGRSRGWRYRDRCRGINPHPRIRNITGIPPYTHRN